jgi:trehalose-6-phosphate synthase
MPIEERRARHQALLAAILDYDIDRWQREFLAALRGDDDITAAVSGARTRPRRKRPDTTYSDPSPARLNPIRKNGGRVPA